MEVPRYMKIHAFHVTILCYIFIPVLMYLRIRICYIKRTPKYEHWGWIFVHFWRKLW